MPHLACRGTCGRNVCGNNLPLIITPRLFLSILSEVFLNCVCREGVCACVLKNTNLGFDLNKMTYRWGRKSPLFFLTQRTQ